MLKILAGPGRQVPFATALIALASLPTSLPAHAAASCASITAPALEIAAVDCTQVWPQLQATRAFPDVFTGSGKMTNVCYMSTGPATAFIGGAQVTITSTLSGWTTDFTPVLFGGTDNLGTVVTQVTIQGIHGNSTAALYTRDTIDLSQIFTTGTSSEEDIIVGGSAYLQNAKGTYRAASTPEDPSASKVELTNLTGVVCVGG